MALIEIGNQFFRDSMALVPEQFQPVTLEQWLPTPFMVDVKVCDGMTGWLRRNFGQESSPMHRLQGCWRRSFVTIQG